ncbi:hypothetical protein [Spirosoma sordidisoli]|uniref:Uncharacterized protein n=1 Tax=Spirosoma sordidisoli TaxID=2502893 RepID=A0A4Q2UM40_9BACT|nr:hypothetical protein [Spirosoma sordidisoli]RYC69812.1 hypothetical protein EQG79_14560 [Spirosoma sordidisoli]
MIIKVGDMVKEMRRTVGLHQPRPFSLVFVTGDRRRGRGGQIRELHKAVLLTKQRTENRTVNLQPLGTNDCICVHLDLILYFNQIPVA